MEGVVMSTCEYVMRHEPPPSLCKHWMPDDGLHDMSVSCACRPTVEGLTGPGVPAKEIGSTVRHRNTLHPLNNRYAPPWKFDREDYR